MATGDGEAASSPHTQAPAAPADSRGGGSGLTASGREKGLDHTPAVRLVRPFHRLFMPVPAQPEAMETAACPVLRC